MFHVHSLHLVTPASHLDPDNKVMDPCYLQGVPGPLIFTIKEQNFSLLVDLRSQIFLKVNASPARKRLDLN